MLSKVELGRSIGEEDLGSGRLLHDIEEISKALYLHKTPPKALVSPSGSQSQSTTKSYMEESKADAVAEDLLHKDKKPSIWKWKPFKALAHIGSHRFSCCFFLHVHSIEGLPSTFNGLNFFVNWKRKDEMLRTRPCRVNQGMVEFEETLMHKCAVYGSRSGPQHSAKYEPKLTLLQSTVIGAPALDIGKHYVDLTRLLPLTLEELEEERRSTGNWRTSFKLSGKAKGAMLNVSFSFSVLLDNSSEPSHFMQVPDAIDGIRSSTEDHLAQTYSASDDGLLHRHSSVPAGRSAHASHFPSRSLDIKILDGVFANQRTQLAHSITFLYRKLEEGNFSNSGKFDFLYEDRGSLKPKSDPAPESTDEDTGDDFATFSVVEQGTEYSIEDQPKLEQDHNRSFNSSIIETIDVAELFEDGMTFEDNPNLNLDEEIYIDYRNERRMEDSKCGENDTCGEVQIDEELESLFCELLKFESGDFDSSRDANKSVQESYFKSKSSFKSGKILRSRSLDDVTESVTNDFLNLLGIEDNLENVSSDDGPESPRECLLRQFEQETLALSNSVLDFDAAKEQVEFSRIGSTRHGMVACTDDFEFSLVSGASDKEGREASQALRSRRNLKMLENLETEALMQEWGLNEKAFQYSPRVNSGGFGSPISSSPEHKLELPPLGDGVGPVVRIRKGGFLRSMNPMLFSNAKNGARLIMQVSKPIVLPPMMGSDVMEILEHWTSWGSENMSVQVNQLMPLEDISGKTMHQVVLESESEAELLERSAVPRRLEAGHDFLDTDCVSLEDLIPSALAGVEFLLIEGLRIQSGLSSQEAPSIIRPLSSSGLSTSKVKSNGGSNCEGAVALGIKTDNPVDELVKLSLPLDQWMRLDSGQFTCANDMDGEILRILASCCSRGVDFGTEESKGDVEQIKVSGQRCGNFTLALRVQLRDPFRNYEMVGSSMLCLVQVERVYVPLQQEPCGTNSESDMITEEDDLNNQLVLEEIAAEERVSITSENGDPWFKISEVLVAGASTEGGGKKLWGTSRQQQCGSRWLLSSGMNRANKRPLSKLTAIIKSSSQMVRKVRSGDTLWSISSNVQGSAAKLKELAAFNIHVRNPDIEFPNKQIRIPEST